MKYWEMRSDLEIVVTFPVTLMVLPPSFKDSCEYIGSTQIIQNIIFPCQDS